MADARAVVEAVLWTTYGLSDGFEDWCGVHEPHKAR
jgi:hypothetical protein